MSIIPSEFLSNASQVLGDTELGLSGRNIISYFAEYASAKQVSIPYHSYPIESSKKDVLLANLNAFEEEDQYNIIKGLCNHERFSLQTPDKVTFLKVQLVQRFGNKFKNSSSESLNMELVEDTLPWLSNHKKSLDLYERALAQLNHSTFDRNLLDNLRLALELFLKDILENNKTLEKQTSSIGIFMKKNGGSVQFTNMFVQLIDYYAKYQNDCVKHDDAVVKLQIELIFEMTSSFMKLIARLNFQSK